MHRPCTSMVQGPLISFNVYFYTNSGTLPATPVYTATNLAYTNTSGNFVIPLTTPAVLAVVVEPPTGYLYRLVWTSQQVESSVGQTARYNPTAQRHSVMLVVALLALEVENGL